MRAPFTQLYLHIVWATWDRLPLVTEVIEERVFAAIAKKCRDLKCEPLAINGIEDHVHLLVRLHQTVAVSQLVKEVKGSSSHLVTHEIKPGIFFKWQGAYRAFTIRKSDVPIVKTYIRNQKQHHADKTFSPEWEIPKTDEESAQADFANVAATSVAGDGSY